MSVRTAELVMAIICCLISIGLMTKSAELRIDWIPGKGPGSGAWPFWLSTGMLLVSITIIVRWFLKISPESRNLQVYMSRDICVVVGISAGSIFFLLVGTHLIGIYLSLLFFLLFYLKVIGGHSWIMTLSFSVIVPIFIFSTCKKPLIPTTKPSKIAGIMVRFNNT